MMGYFKNLEIEMQDEVGDRYPTRRELRSKRRETYRSPNRWVFETVDMIVLGFGFLCAIGLGIIIGIVVVS